MTISPFVSLSLFLCAWALAACSRSHEERAPSPAPSRPPEAASSHSIGPGPSLRGRKLTLALSGETFEQAWKQVEAALSESPAPIDSLDIDAFAAPFGDEGVRRLLQQRPQLAPVRLTLSNAKLTAAGLGALLGSDVPSRLELLDLRDNLIGAAGARLLAESMRLTSLQQLNLGRNHVHAHGAAALAAARGLSSLRRLELEYNFIGHQGARALEQSTALTQLRDLGLAYNFLGDTGARYLAARNWPALDLLDVRGNEIGLDGAKALATSTTLPPGAAIWLGSNVEARALGRLGLARRLTLEGSPARADRATLGELEVFARSKRRGLTLAAPPEDLPSSVEFRELWISEFGLVAEFPIFMLPQRPPGNGKSRTFSWLDRATLAIGGAWLLPGQSVAAALATWKQAEPGEELRVDARNAYTIVVRHSGGAQRRVVRVQSADGALFYVDFAYPAELEAYFAPIVARAIDSVYFDRARSKH